jgi:serine/threonine protein kinase
LKIADFGLARILEDESLSSTTCGTPNYCAPEILRRKPYGKACDFWSIGVVAYVILSGDHPFYCDDNIALYEMIKACKYDFKDEAWSSVSEEAKDFISRILVPDPLVRLNCQ